MKTKMRLFFTGIMAMAILSTLSCSKDNDSSAPETGYLKLSDIGVSLTFTNTLGKGVASKGAALVDDPIPSFDTWQVIVNDDSGNELANIDDYSTIIPAEGIELPEGTNYTVTVNSENNTVDFDNPYFEGTSAVFDINGGAATAVAVEAKPANARISVNYDTSITDGSTYSDFTTTVTVEDLDGVEQTLTYTMADYDGKLGYYPYQKDAKINVVLVPSDGSDNIELGLTIDGIPALDAGDDAPNYIVNISESAEVGAATLTISASAARDDKDVQISLENIACEEDGDQSFNSTDFKVTFGDGAFMGDTRIFASGNSTVTLEDNPELDVDNNTSCNVSKFNAFEGDRALYANMKFTLQSGAFLFDGSQGFKVKVYCTVAPTKIGVKVSSDSDGTGEVLIQDITADKLNKWVELDFRFGDIDDSYNYFLVFPGHGERKTNDFYIDDIIYY